MRHLHVLLTILIVSLCSFLSMAEDSSSSISINVLTLTSYTTVSPIPIVVTSSEFVTPADEIPVTLTSALVIIYTVYPTNESPVRETATEFQYPTTYPASVAATVATLSTSTMSLSIPQTTDSSNTIETDGSSTVEPSSSSTINKSTGPMTSSTRSATSTSKPSNTPTSSKTSSSAIGTGTLVSTPPDNHARKSIPMVAIIVPAIVGAILAIAAIGLLLWWLRRRNLKKKGNNASNSMALRQNIHDGYNQCMNTGNRVSCQARTPRNDRLSVLDTLGLTDKKLWPSWPFGDKMTLGTGAIKQAMMGAAVPVSSTPSRPVRSYEHELQFVTSPRPAELPGDPTLSENEVSTAHQQQTGNDTSMAPPIPPKSPDRDLKLYGRNATGHTPSASEPANVKKSIDDTSLPRWSNFDGHLSNHTSELHGAVASPSTPTTAWPHGSNPQIIAPALPQAQKDSVATPAKIWIEPPSRFSTPSNSTSPNATSNGSVNNSPKQWIEPTSNAATGTRNRAYNATPPSPVEADDLRTVAERDNTLAMLEGRQKAHVTGSISGIFGGNEQLRLYNESVKRARKRSVHRGRELRSRFPFARPPVPGTVTDATHDVSYTTTEAGTSIQRVDKDNGLGGWM